MPSRLWLLLAVPLLLRLLKRRPGPSREQLVPPKHEHVLLLGASSGIGRDLAHAYARRGAFICLVARRKEALDKVKEECVAHGLEPSRVLVVPANITSTEDLLNVRAAVEKAWGGLDTLHILAGVPSTSTLMEATGVTLKPADPAGPAGPTGSSSTTTTSASAKFKFERTDGKSKSSSPDKAGMDRIAVEARACAEINYVGTVLALACFLPLLANSSRSPAVHHLSSVAATIPAPCRAIYSATKAAAFMAFESCRVECEGSGVRFFSLLPGTIANDFRTKTAVAETGGRDETKLPIRHSWEKLLLQPEQVVRAILSNLALPPAPQPLIPCAPFSWIPQLRQPPPSVVHLPFMYAAARWMGMTWLGWGYVEPSARRKYGLPN
ncbi:hypothetical protein EHS25_000229 [Saitozyma podzolica]|uniref:NAD(P)-binding protein n=1 Tax=Saitozyma podzolica TaxID=1890683 RepID=A0A427YVI1_9TREE|nr:hypothetical protein EHS25_000229 [Saitozyma podzolica]